MPPPPPHRAEHLLRGHKRHLSCRRKAWVFFQAIKCIVIFSLVWLSRTGATLEVIKKETIALANTNRRRISLLIFIPKRNKVGNLLIKKKHNSGNPVVQNRRLHLISFFLFFFRLWLSLRDFLLIFCVVYFHVNVRPMLRWQGYSPVSGKVRKWLQKPTSWSNLAILRCVEKSIGAGAAGVEKERQEK